MSVRQLFGTYAAQVYNTADPQKANRVQLKIPQVLGIAISQWALPVSPGVQAPAPGTSVIAMFLGGDPSHPVYYSPLVNPTFTGKVTLPDTVFGNINGQHTEIFADAHEQTTESSGSMWIESLPEHGAILFKNTSTGDFSIIAGQAGTDSWYGHNDSFGVGFTGQVTAWQPGTAYPNLVPESWHTINSGFPTGWTGVVNYTLLSESAKLVMYDVALSIANATVVTNGEQICAIPPPYYYATDNKVFAVNNSQTALQVPLFLNSHLNYNGPAFTASGTVYLYGQAIITTAV